MVLLYVTLLLSFGCSLATSPWSNANCRENRVAIVHLFEWTWTSIARECEEFLGPMGYCGVQVSPPNEHVLITLPEADRPWWERYQPVSYKLVSRSGTREEFIDMVERCNEYSVNIYVDAVINHMAGMGRVGDGSPSYPFGSAGSSFSTLDSQMDFPGVPFTTSDFNGCENCGGCCCINAWMDHDMVRNCPLLGLADIAMHQTDTRNKVRDFLNDLIGIGVAGFRVDAAKHMWPDDLLALWNSLNDLRTNQGETVWFPAGSKAFQALEVIDMNQQGEVNVHMYSHVGRPTEFRYCVKVREATGWLPSMFNMYDPGWGMLAGEDAFVFVDNHDNQRGHGVGDPLTFNDNRDYKLAQAITLSNTYGHPRLMSSYYFSNGDQGPPTDGTQNVHNTLDVAINSEGICTNGWVCEHRWQEIAGMASWAKAVNGESIHNTWTPSNRVAFSRGNKGFIAMVNDGTLDENLYTALPAGRYCDVITGCPSASGCTGGYVDVDSGGFASIQIYNTEEPILAIHVEAMSGSDGCIGEGGAVAPPTVDPTTPGPTTPPPTGTQRTVIFLYGQTVEGEDMFIRGGIDHQLRTEPDYDCTQVASTSDCAIDITHNQLGTSSHYDKHNAWRVGDAYLDWYGAEPGQGTYQGETPHGTPLVWTSNSPGSPGYRPENIWSDHYWLVDFNMNCEDTEDGWFELKGYITNQGWEPDVSQFTECSGTAGGQRPYITGNHMARCGKFNVFMWGQGQCTIDNL